MDNTVSECHDSRRPLAPGLLPGRNGRWKQALRNDLFGVDHAIFVIVMDDDLAYRCTGFTFAFGLLEKGYNKLRQFQQQRSLASSNGS